MRDRCCRPQGSAPRRPRWRVLYGSLLLVALAGVGGHALAATSLTGTVDAASAFGMFLILVAWTRANRVAISLLECIGAKRRSV